MFYKTVRRFLDPDGSQGGAPAGEQTNQQSQQNAAPQIDYGKIQQMLDGTLAAKEDTALKAYFKQQGLSQQEVEQAIATFKEQKAANQPNVEALQQAATAAAEARQAHIQQATTMAAVGLGISVTSIPYVLFQSTLPRGERLWRLFFCCKAPAISIRAPARGATSTNTIMSTIEEFQSTLPRGERR